MSDFSPQQSLALIQSMIDKTKTDFSENKAFFLLWGWVSLIGILGQWFLKVVMDYPRHYLSWLVLIIGFGGTVYLIFRMPQKKSETYVGAAMSQLWTGMGIAFGLLSLVISFLPVQPTGWMYSYPFFMILYGLGTFVSGQLLQFAPLRWGGVISWALAIAAAFIHNFDHHLLLAAAAIVACYLVPGYLLKNKPD